MLVYIPKRAFVTFKALCNFMQSYLAATANKLKAKGLSKNNVGKWLGRGQKLVKIPDRYIVQSNLVIRNFLITLKLFLNAKCSLSLCSKLPFGHGKCFLNTNLFRIKTFLIAKFVCTKKLADIREGVSKIMKTCRRCLWMVPKAKFSLGTNFLK